MSEKWFTYIDSSIQEYDSVNKFPPNCVGFVYKIINIKTGKFYIGKKSLYSTTKRKLTKVELAEQSGPGRKATSKKITKESNWINYWGSNEDLLKDVKQDGKSAFRREILKFCFSKKSLTYWELHYQCVEEVLLTDKSYNSNILGKFYPSDLASPLDILS